MVVTAVAALLTAGPAYAAGEPTGLTITPGDGTLTVAWTAPADVTPVSYEVRHRQKNTSTWTTSSAISHPTVTYTLQSLVNGTVYEVQARTSDPGPSSWVSAEATPRTKPATPAAPVLSSGDGTLAVSWTAPADGGSAITDYDVQYRQAGRSLWQGRWDGGSASYAAFGAETSNGPVGNPLDLGELSALSDTLTRESVGTNPGVYKLDRAVDGLSIGFTGITISEVTLRARYAATKPTTTTLHTHGTVVWSVTATCSHGVCVPNGSGTTPPLAAGSYVWLETSAAATYTSRSGTISADLPTTATTRTISGLTNGTEYQVQVRASNAAGESAWSASSMLNAGVPAAPAAPTLTPGNATISVNWSAPDTNGAAINDYDVRHSADSGANWTELADNTNSTARTATISTLTNGTSYQVQVRAGNTNGDGPWSPSATMTPGVPAAPAAPTLTPGNATISVNWSAPDTNGAAINDYDVRHSADSGANWTELADNTNSTARTATISTLTNGTSYQVQVRAGNTNGDGPWSPSATMTPGVPAAPPAPAVTAGNASRSLTVTWAVPSNNGSTLTSIEVRHKLSSGSSWTQTTITDSSAVNTTLSNLTDGVSYDVQTAATNAHGTGPWSPSTVATPGVPGVPDAPALVSGNATMTVIWAPPSGNGGSAINDYDVRHSTDGSTWTELADNTNSTSTSATISTLTNGTSYQVQVRAGNTNGDGPWSPSATLKAGLPAKPATPTLAAANAKLTVTWTAPSGNGSDVTGFKVRYRQSSDTTWSTHTFSSSGSTTTTTITGLTNATRYDVQVLAANTHGDGAWSDSAAGTPTTTAPGKANAPSATPGGGQVTLWGFSVTDTGGSTITDWDVRWSSDSGTTWTEEADTTDNNIFRVLNVADLIGGQSYVFSVRAENANGTGGWSDASSPAVAIPARAPAAPAAPALVPGDQSLAVSWDAPNNNGAAITDYDVQHSTDGSTWTEWNASDTSTTRSATITGLTNGTSYQVQVRAVNTHGNGAWSASATLAPGTPAAPAAPVLASASATSLTVSWSPPASTGASAITDYDVRHSADSGANWTSLADNTNSTATSATISTLTTGTAYQVQVRAQNANGEGPWSASATMTAGVPATPAAPALVSGNASIAVSWTAPADHGASLSGFKVRHKQSSATSWTETTVSGGSTTTTSLASLTNGTSYDVQVAATNSRGDSGWSPSATLKAGLPAAPAAPALTAGKSRISLTWTAPADNGSAITDYDARYKKSTDTTWVEWKATETSTTRSATITGLDSSSTYDIQVRAENSAGPGPWSASASLSPDSSAPEAPAAPTLAAGANASLIASWTEPEDNDFAISDYDVRHSTDQSTWTELADDTNSTALTATITGLTDGTLYYVQVRAGNSDGDGAWSPSASLTAGAPATPAAPAVTATNDQQIGLAWNAPADNGASITDYDVRYSSDSGATWTETTDSTDSTALTATVTGLTNGTSYRMQVRAQNSRGNGAWSRSASATPGARPSAPTLTLAPGDSQFTASWSAPASGETVTHYHVRFREKDTQLWDHRPNVTYDQSLGDYQPSNLSGGDALDLGSVALTGLTVTKPTITGVTHVYRLSDHVGSLRVRLTGTNSFSHSVTYQARYSATSPSATNLTTHGTQLWSVALASGAMLDGDAWSSALPANTYFWVTSNTSGRLDRANITLTANNATLTARTLTVSSLANGTSLADGTTYQVQVRAGNDSGESSWTATSEVVAGVPAAPAAPVLTLSSASLSVAWNAPANNGAAITGYSVEHSTDGTTWLTTGVTVTASTRTAAITGLTAGTEYRVRVRATNANGSGPWSPSSRVQAGAPAAPAPKLVPGSGSLTVSWDAPANNGAAITDYDVRYRLTGASTWTYTPDTTPSTTRSATLTPLTDNSEYEVQVSATNANGTSAWSASVTHKAGVPAVPGTPALTVGNNTIDATWTAPAYTGSSLSYDVEHSTDGTTWLTTGVSVTVSTRTAAITGLTNSTEYRVRVRASNSVGDGPWSEAAKATPGSTVPAAPAAPTLSSGNAQLTVSWTAPATGGSALTGFKVQYKRSTDNTWTAHTFSSTGSTTTTTITGLTNGTAYDVQVAATNANGDSPWSTTASVTLSAAPAAPSAPTVTTGNGSLAVSWSAPNDNGASIHDYDVGYCTGACANDSDWSQSPLSLYKPASTDDVESSGSTGRALDLGTVTVTGATVTEVTTGSIEHVYKISAAVDRLYVALKATNDSSGVAQTYVARYAATAPTTSNMNTHGTQLWSDNVAGDGSTSTSAAGWTGALPANTHFWIATLAASRSDAVQPTIRADYRFTSTSHTLTGLTNGSAYKVRVRAANSVGEGAWSAQATATPGLPAAPTGVSLTSGPASLAAAWTAGANNGSAIYHYEARYRTVGTNTWTTATGTAKKWQPNAILQEQVDGPSGNAYDMGSIADGTLDVNVDNESIGSHAGVYELEGGVARLRVKLDANSQSNSEHTVFARTAPTKPTAANLTTHGTQMWSDSQPTGGPTAFSGDAWTGPLPSGSYFWVTMSALGAVQGGRPVIETDPAVSASPRSLGGLTAGTSYEVQVRAHNANGASPWSTTVTGKAGAPAAPSAPTAAPASATSVTVTWTAVTGATGYTVGRCSAGCDQDASWTTANVTGENTTTHTFTGLTAGTSYQVRVRAANANGSGAWSQSATQTAGTPAAPTAPTLAVRHQSLAVSWTAPADNGSSLTGFKVQYKLSTASTWTAHTFSSTGSTTSTTITGLQNGSAYDLQVAATNTHGDSAWSPTASDTPATTAPATPAAPVVAPGNASLNVSWAAPNDNGSAITDYDVGYCTGSCADDTDWSEAPISTYYHSGTGRNGLTSNGSTGQALDLGTVTITNVTVTKVTTGGISNVYKIGSAVGRLRVALSAKNARNGSNLTYVARYANTAPSTSNMNTHGTQLWTQTIGYGSRLSNASAWTPALPADAHFWITTTASGTSDIVGPTIQADYPFTSTSHTVTDLTNGTTYKVRVRAANAGGDSAWSSITQLKAGVPSAPAAPTITASGNGSLTATWTEPATNGSAVTDYDVRYSTDNGSTWSEFNSSNTSTATTATVTGLTNNTSYVVSVRAANTHGEGAWSPASAAAKPGLPAAPAAPTLVPGSGSLTATWAAASGNGNTVTGYDVEYCSTACTTESNWSDTNVTVTLATRTAAITGLTDNTSYQVRVRATNSVGDGPWSSPATHKAGVPAVPGTPTLTAGNARIDVAWTAPAYTGSSLDYDVEHSTDGSTWATTGVTVTVSSRTAAITGLTNGTEYRVRVRASNSVGDGPWSAEVKATPQTQKPGAPAAPTLTSRNAQLLVSWTAPTSDGGSAITDYDVRYSSDSGANWTELADNTNSTVTSATISMLTNGTSYQVQVRAGNARGDGPWSASATLKAGVPAAPAPSLVPGSASLAVSWAEPADNGNAITDYDVRYKLTSASTWTETADTSPSTTRSATLSPLTDNSEYEVQVRAGNSVGDGPWSASATHKAGVPAATGTPTLTAGHTRLDVAWTAPAYTGSGLDYDVEHSTDGSTWATTGVTVTVSSRTAAITGLTNDTEYQVRVRASNSVGDGPWSAVAKATPVVGVAVAPATPAAPVVAPGNASLNVSWTAPNDNGSAITDYDVGYCTGSCADDTDWSEGPISTYAQTGVGNNGLTSNGSTGQALDLGTVTITDVTVTKVTTGGISNVYKIGSAVGRLRVSLVAKNATNTGTVTYEARYANTAPSTSNMTSHGTQMWTRSVGYGSSFYASAWTPALPADAHFWITTTASGTSDIVGPVVQADYPFNRTSHTVTSLTNATTYKVRVRAANAGGDSAWSSITQQAAGVPSAPAAPTITASGNGSLTATWTEPANNGSAITDYDVRYSTDNGSTWTEFNSSNTSTATTATVTGLTNNTSYVVSVRAANTHGQGPWSPASAATKPGLPAAPAAPALVPGSGSLTATWAAASGNGNTVTAYTVQYCSTACTTESNWSSTNVTVTVSSRTAAITGLTDNTSYQVRVRATNTVGDGPWSTTASHKAGVPAVTGTPTLTAGNTRIDVAWTAPAYTGAGLDYDVEHSTDGTTWTDTGVTVTVSSRTAAITGLTNDTEYRVRVRASNSVGDGPWSAVVKATPQTQRPGAPAAPTLGSGNAQISVSWTAPADNGGSAITAYAVEYSTDGNTWSSTNVTVTFSTLSATITGLTNGTAYQVRVRATNSRGSGAWSPATTDKPGKPEKPSAPTVSGASRSLSVSWTAPTENGLSITDYDVQYKLSTDTDWSDHSFTGTTVATTITSLRGAATYQVRVRASSTAGAGPWSLASAGTATLAGRPDAPAPVVTSGPTKLIVEWPEPATGGSAITDYDVRYSSDSGATWTETADTTNSTALAVTISGLTNGTSYQVQARATNAQGDSAWSASVTRQAGAPSAPRSAWVKATSDGKGLAVSFLGPSDVGGSAVTGYGIRYRAVGTTTWVSHTPTSSTLSDWEYIRPLDSNTEYEVQARAVNSRGFGAWSDSGPGSTARRFPGAPEWWSIPTRPHLAPAEGGIGVAWSAPSSAVSAVTDYDVQYRLQQANDDFISGPWTDWAFTGTGRSTVITGVHPEGRYLVRVRASNGIGTGSWSDMSQITPSMLDDHYACLVEGTTLLRVGAGCFIYGGYHGGGRNHTFDSVEVCGEGSDETTCVALGSSPALLAKQNQTFSKVRIVAYDGTGGTRVVRTKLGDVVRGVFTIKVIPFDIGDVTFLEGAPLYQQVMSGTPPTLTVNTTYKLKVGLKSPYNRSSDTELPGCTPTETDPCLARTWVDLSFPEGSSMTGRGFTGDYSSAPRQILGWRRAYLIFRLQTGATPGPGPITVSAYGAKPIPGGCSFDGDENQIFERCYTPPTPTKPAQYNVASGAMQMNVVATEGADPVPPAAVAATAAAGGATSVAVTWTEPSSPAAPVDGYEVQHRRTGATAWTDLGTSLDATARAATVTGLAGGTYEVRVRARSAFGWGDWTDPPATATIVGLPPAAPTGLTATAGDQSVTLSWDDPSNTSITGYEYQTRWAGVGWQAWVPIPGSDADTTTHTITGLANGTEYRFKIRAVNAGGSSPIAPVADPWFVAATPQPPPATPSSVSVTRGDGTVTATWASVPGATSYHVTYTTDNGGSWHLAALNHPAAPGTTTITIEDADNGDAYIVAVRARNSAGDSEWRNSPPAGPYVPPPATPSSVSVTRGDETVTASWPSVAGATSYHVTYTTDNGASWHLAALNHPAAPGATTTITIDDADNGAAYIVAVRARNSAGDSEWRNSPPAAPQGPPTAPTGLTATAGDQSVTLTWDDPTNPAITGYQYQMRWTGVGWGEWITIPDSDAATTSHTITGLQPGTEYRFKIRAVNTAGSSPIAPVADPWFVAATPH